MIAQEELARLNMGKTTFSVATDTSFAGNKMPAEAHDRLEEGSVLTFPATLEGNVVDCQLGGHAFKGLVCSLKYQEGQTVNYVWYPQTWLRAHRPLVDGKTAAVPVVWGGAAAVYASLAREKGYDAAVATVLGKAFRAENLREFEARGFNGRLTVHRVFDMVEVSASLGGFLPRGL